MGKAASYCIRIESGEQVGKIVKVLVCFFGEFVGKKCRFFFTFHPKSHIIVFVGGVWLSLVRAHGWGP